MAIPNEISQAIKFFNLLVSLEEFCINLGGKCVWKLLYDGHDNQKRNSMNLYHQHSLQKKKIQEQKKKND